MSQQAMKRIVSAAHMSSVKGNFILADDIVEKYAYSPAGLLPKDTVTFFRYEGSLTTPPCTEGVVWTILVEPRYVSEKELNFLRHHVTTEGEHLRHNWRPTQPLNNRTIYLNRANHFALVRTN
ncbi:hypothetical protein ANCDUO_04401 [Ancylostoma duodenale]|uniref:carbonic anhydrase n=1 Tax=Ancylostoma duodenale TaxID=51022 RepID=A0A0C2H126_9BILA|nr:hypothetical protein ANCDUO_04401 [Ancylostoma duodenale]